MDRRAFLRLIGGAAAVAAAAPAIPFGRVWSFPSKIVIPQTEYQKRYQLGLDDYAAGVDVAFGDSVTIYERWSFDQKTKEITRERFSGDDRGFRRVDSDKVLWPRDTVPMFAVKSDLTWSIFDEQKKPVITL